MLVTNNSDLNKLSYGFGILFLMGAGIQQFLTPYFINIGMPEMGFHMLIIIYSFILLTNFFAPPVIVKYGAKQLIVLSATVYIISCSIVLIEQKCLIYIAAILFGIAGAFLWLAQNSYIIKISKPETLGKNSGFFMAIYSLGSSLASLVLGYLICFCGYQKAFSIILIISILSILLFISLTSISSVSKSHEVLQIFKMFKSKTLIICSLTSFSSYYVFGIFISKIPLHIKSILLDEKYIGILSSLFYIMPILIAGYVGKKSDTIGREAVVFIGYIVMITGLILLVFANNMYFLSFGIFTLSIAFSTLTPIIMALPGDIYSNDNLEYITGMFMLLKYLGIISGVSAGYTLHFDKLYLLSIALIFIILLLSIHGLYKGLSYAKEKIQIELLN
ncbi:Major facilitator superfamily MFS-1 [Candidatus Magnetomorum sp. HK-1]|nr:Major facilitator superfamily MFS-1 [Candidatus Magnetomorum sp. HK-1]